MEIKIGRRTYQSNPAMITLVRYMTAFGESFLNGEMGVLQLARLVWASLEEPKPDFLSFLQSAADCKNFPEIAEKVQSAVMSRPSKSCADDAKTTGNHEETDELDVLAIMAVAGLDINLINVLPMAYITEVICRKGQIISGSTAESHGKRRFYKMSNAEMVDRYGRRKNGNQKEL